MTIIEFEKKLIDADNVSICENIKSFEASTRDSNGNNILNYYIMNKKNINFPIDLFLSLLDSFNFDYDAKQNKGQKRSPLALTILYNEKEMFNALMNRCVDVENPDVNGNTPLFNATMEYKGDSYYIENLLKNHADPNKVNKYNVSPVKLAYTIANTDVRKLFANGC